MVFGRLSSAPERRYVGSRFRPVQRQAAQFPVAMFVISSPRSATVLDVSWDYPQRQGIISSIFAASSATVFDGLRTSRDFGTLVLLPGSP
jgi:hypothetical protein